MKYSGMRKEKGVGAAVGVGAGCLIGFYERFC